MSMYTKKATAARKELTAEMKRMKKRLGLTSHHAAKATWALFPLKMRKDVRVVLSQFGDSISFTVWLTGLESFKDKRLTSVLAAFATPEWRAHTNDWTGGDEPNRDYKFERSVIEEGEPSFNIQVGIYAYVKSDSPTCRIVLKEVKEEVVRKEERVIVCD